MMGESGGHGGWPFQPVGNERDWYVLDVMI